MDVSPEKCSELYLEIRISGSAEMYAESRISNEPGLEMIDVLFSSIAQKMAGLLVTKCLRLDPMKL